MTTYNGTIRIEITEENVNETAKQIIAEINSGVLNPKNATSLNHLQEIGKTLSAYIKQCTAIKQALSSKIEKAEGLIDDSLREKYDKIVSLNGLIKKVVTKKDYLKEYISLKDKRISNYELDRKLVEAMNIIKEVKSDYDKLDNKEFNKELKDIEAIDEALLSGKNYYNKYTSGLNRIIQKFPTNIVAKIHRYKIKPFFDGKNMQDAVIDDFKL